MADPTRGVGKSCLLLRFSDGSFTTSFITTIGSAIEKLAAFNINFKLDKEALTFISRGERPIFVLGSSGIPRSFALTSYCTFAVWFLLSAFVRIICFLVIGMRCHRRRITNGEGC
ncbi:Ras-related protein RABE1c [Artemisia annua]|uniref:Ras-related protein RABE1c n=1 Tax=Artemisia annua TaxID=35608 RepID=A0A2U1PBR3_ARTAN|nr:Ras-related protein RABE1c [Artemisia annua]